MTQWKFFEFSKKKLSMRFGETDIAKLENSRSFLIFKKISKFLIM